MPIRDIRLLKTELRQKYKRIRKNLEPEKQRALDSEIQTRLLTLRQYREKRCDFHLSLKPIEVDTFNLVRAAWANRKKVAVPGVCLKPPKWSFTILPLWTTWPGAFGVLEPIPERCQMVTDYSRGCALSRALL